MKETPAISEPLTFPVVVDRLRQILCTGLMVCSTVFCLLQFKADDLTPLIFGWLLLLPLGWMARRWWYRMTAVAAASTVIFFLDAGVLHHRLAVEARTLGVLWGVDHVEDTLTSPSGRTVAYIVGTHWLDSTYRVYFSTSGLFLRMARISGEASDPIYPRDITAAWNGRFFVAGESLPSLAYDEQSAQIHDYDEWRFLAPNEPATREAFAAYLRRLQDL